MVNRYTSLLIVFAFVFIMPTIVAQTPSHEQNTNITLSVPCTSDGDVCPGGTACVATVIGPDQTLILNDEAMTQNAAVFDVNLSSNQTSSLGLYEFSVSCCDGPRCFSKTLEFFITPSGAPPLSSGQGTIVLTIIIILFGINVLLYVLGFRMENRPGKLLTISLAVIMTGGLILYGLVLLNETVAGSPTLVAGMSTFFVVFRVIAIILLLLLIGVVFAVVLRQFNIRRGTIDPD